MTFISTRSDNRIWIVLSLLIVLAFGRETLAQTTSFTYQGKLSDNGNLANTSYDMQFKLFDNATVATGTQQGGTVTLSAVQVTDGIFTVQLDFGAAAFPGADRFIEIAVKQAGGPTYTTLAPRQPVSSTPYSIRSLNSIAADGLSVACVNCITSSQIQSVQGSQITGALPVGSIPAGSGNYIQNTTNQQEPANFNIAGSGVANVFNAIISYQLGGSAVLSNKGTNNLFAGVNAGTANTTGQQNAFFGASAGSLNTTGVSNAFFGYAAGRLNTVGVNNASFGSNSGSSNTTGNDNSFFGTFAGHANTTGGANTFIGDSAGQMNTTASNNTFVGSAAGQSNTAANNTFVGRQAGYVNTTGVGNSFFGAFAGAANITGSQNAFFGYFAGNMNTGSFNSFYGFQAGIFNTTGSNNSYFGFQAGNFGTIGANNSFFGANTGETNTGGGNAFFGSQAGTANTTGSSNSFFGYNAGAANTTASNNAFFGPQAGFKNTLGHDNTFIGNSAGLNNTIATGNTFVGSLAGQGTLGGGNNTFLGLNAGNANLGSSNTYVGVNANGLAFLTNASAVGSSAFAGQNNSLILGSVNGINGATADTDVGIGTTTPLARLDVAANSGHILLGDAGCGGGFIGFGFGSTLGGCSNFSMVGNGTDTIINRPSGGIIALREANVTQLKIAAGGAVTITGSLAVLNINSPGSFSLCYDAQASRIAQCSSSLRYKTNIAAYQPGLDVIKRLRPITFDWKAGGMHDLGFGAEEVAAVEPLLVTHNPQGQIEGVKYDRISAALVNAVNQLQQQIATQQKQIDELNAIKAENAELKVKIACILAYLEQADKKQAERK